tara:strand:+ start:5901 stop:7064 length:1164 start_codon:yes stop_codon:yes gene_type:complete
MQDTYQIPLFKVLMNPDLKDSVLETLMSGKISQYGKVKELEKKLGDFLKNDKVLTVNSGTSALHLAYHILKKPDPDINWPGLQEGDEVLTTSLTCVATNWPILANNLKIKWVDIDPNNVNINMDDLRSKLSEKTKIISVVHWGGYPCDLTELENIKNECLQKYGFKPYVLEDGAHSFGAKFNGKPLGNHGNLVMFSLQAIKHFTTIDGGLLILPNTKLYERAKLIRFFGIDRERKNKQKDFRVEDDVVEWGYKFHMNDVNATVGLGNLDLAIDKIKIHRDNAKYYFDNLQNVKDLQLLENKNDRVGSWWLFTMRVKRRSDFIEHMKKHSIMTSQVHGRNDIHTCVQNFKCSLPLLDKYEEEIVCIPVGWWVTPDQRKFIVDKIKLGW